MNNFKQGIPADLLALVDRVRVEVVPKQLQKGREVKFEISMNTRSVLLAQDLTKISLLEDDQGHEYHPLRWNGSPPGGHHRRGTLEFPALTNGAKAITLYIKNVADVPERTFKWKIGQTLLPLPPEG